ncbi:MAG TPA: mannosyltransferase family protein [Solirubrobacteraceae bacterium]
METLPDSAGPLGDEPVGVSGMSELELRAGAATVVEEPVRVRAVPQRAARRARLSVAARQELLWITVIYLAARGLLLLVAYLNGAFGHHNFLHELANWDGLWYRSVANQGYPHAVSFAQTNLGFFPLFPLAIYVVEQPLLLLTSHDAIWCSTVAGLLVSGAGGLVATVLVHRLAEGWWDRETARRATIFFVVFPGSVVFSMVYSEGLLLPLAAGCIYALERRRWLLAGVLAALGTAVQPVGLVLVPVCLVAALREWRRWGWSVRPACRAFLAPILSLTGVGGFMAFLWAWTGNPFATYIAQHHGWSETTTPLSLWHMAQKLASEVSFQHFNEPTINLNLVVGLIGGVVLAVWLVLVYLSRREISPEAILWTLAIAFLAYTSSNVPPLPRMLITAFPALMVVGRYVRGRWFRVIVWGNGILLAGLSMLTFYGFTLRP